MKHDTLTLKEFEAANERGQRDLAEHPHALSVHYDAKAGRVVVELSTGMAVAFPPQMVQGLQDASAAQLQAVKVLPPGLAIFFPKLDLDLSIPGLVAGVLGTRKWMMQWLAAEAGRTKSAAKADAARRNGKLGGRPRKAIVGRALITEQSR